MSSTGSFFTDFGDAVANLTDFAMGPDLLYRYRSADTSYFGDEIDHLINKRELYWPIYKELNDPFDCQPSLEKGVSLREFRQKLLPVITVIQAQASREIVGWRTSDTSIERMVKKKLASYTFPEIKHLYEERFENLIRMALDGVSVLSLCEDFNNPVMWSMYGNRGNGVCFGFKNERTITEFGNSERWTTEKLKVEYSDVRPKYDYWGALSTFLFMTPDSCKLIPRQYQKYLLSGIKQSTYLWRKHSRWSYEQEHRLVLHLGYPPSDDHAAGKYRKAEGLKLKSIRIGPEVSNRTEKLIVDTIGESGAHIRIFKGKRSDKEYALTFEEIGS